MNLKKFSSFRSGTNYEGCQNDHVLLRGIETDIPDAYAHTIRIQHGEIDEEITIADLAGKRLSLTYRNAAGMAMSAGTTPVSMDVIAAGVSIPHETSKTLDRETVSEPAAAARVLPDMKMPGRLLEDGSEGMAATSSALDFGKVPPDGWSEVTTNITNTNSVTIRLVVSLVNNGSNAYSIISGGETHNVGTNQTHSITVRFSGSSQSPGTRTAQLRVEWWHNDSRFADNYIDLTGVVAHPLTLGGCGMNAQTFMNEPCVETCRIENNGVLPLTINSASLTGADPSRFQIISTGSGIIEAGGNRDIQVRYLANAHGTHNASIYFDMTYDGLPYNGDVLSLQGKAVYKPDLTGSYGFDFGQTYPDDTKERGRNNFHNYAS